MLCCMFCDTYATTHNDYPYFLIHLRVIHPAQLHHIGMTAEQIDRDVAHKYLTDTIYVDPSFKVMDNRLILQNKIYALDYYAGLGLSTNNSTFTTRQDHLTLFRNHCPIDRAKKSIKFPARVIGTLINKAVNCPPPQILEFIHSRSIAASGPYFLPKNYIVKSSLNSIFMKDMSNNNVAVAFERIDIADPKMKTEDKVMKDKLIQHLFSLKEKSEEKFLLLPLKIHRFETQYTIQYQASVGRSFARLLQ